MSTCLNLTSADIAGLLGSPPANVQQNWPAVYTACAAQTLTDGPTMIAVVATIGISVFAHGLTSRPLTNRFVGWYASHPREELPAMESVPREVGGGSAVASPARRRSRPCWRPCCSA